MTKQYIQLTPEKRQELLKIAGSSDRLVREQERKNITSLSRSETWKKERENTHPHRIVLGKNSCAWLFSDLLSFIYQQANTHTPSQK